MGASPSDALPSNNPKVAGDKTPFLVYESGTPYFIPNSIYAQADYVLGLFKKADPDAAFEQLRKETGNVGYSLQNSDLNTVWLKYVEFFETARGRYSAPGPSPRNAPADASASTCRSVGTASQISDSECRCPIWVVFFVSPCTF